MIGLIVKNNLCLTTFLDLLSSLSVEAYCPDKNYDAILTTEECDVASLKDIPIISLGLAQKGESFHIDTPIHPDDLVHQIQIILSRLYHRITFENTDFVFQSANRSLLLKESDTLILLTEKENDLLTALAEAYPKAMDKESLLERVWNYRPDTETHTLESHIYTLRQKIGPKADSLIKSTPTGYVLVTDPRM